MKSQVTNSRNSGAGSALNGEISAEERTITPPQEFSEFLRNIGADMRKVRANLDAMYMQISKAADSLEFHIGAEYAEIYERYGWEHHAARIMQKIDQSEDMEAFGDKLRNLKQFVPEVSPLMVEFGRVLADRLNPRLLPMGLHLAQELTLMDLQQGTDGFAVTSIKGLEPLSKSSLALQPPITYALIRARMLDVVDRLLPPRFAQGYREWVAETMRQMLSKFSERTAQ